MPAATTSKPAATRPSIDWVIELNRQALFHDMENEHLRAELVHWLRFGEREEEITHDGLSARCLGFSARLLKSLFTNTGFWTLAGHQAGRRRLLQIAA